MQTRDRNAVVLAVAAIGLSAGLIALGQQRRAEGHRFRALDAVPRSALLVAVVDMGALRASPVGGPFLQKGREIPGLGKVKDLCGFDPMERMSEIALAIPEGGDSGDFGLVAAGDLQEKALIDCASKVILGRGGTPSVTTIGSFRTVRDTSLTESGGEIAVRDGGPLLLGAGSYLRSMIDTAEQRAPSIQASQAHGWLAREVGKGEVRVTVVLSKEQRQTLAEELRAAGSEAAGAAVLGGALGVELGPTVTLHGVIACDGAEPCARLGRSLAAARDARAADLGVRLSGFGAVLDQLKIEPAKDLIHLRVGVPVDQAATLAERLIQLRGMRHPMPRDEAGAPAGAPGGVPSAMAPPAGSAAPAATAAPSTPSTSSTPSTPPLDAGPR
ncbi:MAG: hypothetical protein U0359_33335 [Byssovorax sp.]